MNAHVFRIAGVTLPATVNIPTDARSVVIFAHGAGSDRHSPRNLIAANALREKGHASVLFDLLTEEEKASYGDNVFDIAKLTERLTGVTAHVRAMPETQGMPIAYLGASTGAAAALNAAASLGNAIAAVVSRGGRPDLADQTALPAVTAATCFIIGDADVDVLAASEPPFALLRCEKRLATVPEATHLFEEPGTLERATEVAVEWISTHVS